MIPRLDAGVRTGARILIVDDAPDSAESMARLLRIFGHEVQVASDGPQALAAAHHWRPEFVLLDLGLPGMDGYEVAIRLRQEALSPGFVIIAITGYGREEDRQRSRAAGIDHHFVKPVRPELLLPLLSRPEYGSDFEVCSPERSDSSAAVASGGVLARCPPLEVCNS